MSLDTFHREDVQGLAALRSLGIFRFARPALGRLSCQTLGVMTAPIQIRYSLVGKGWSSCVVEYEGKRIELSASYLSDALGNLVKAALAMASGFRTVEFAFDEEPGEYRWVLEATENTVLRFRVLEFQELWRYKPTIEGRPMLDESTTPVAFAKAVRACAAEVLREYGEKGYAEKWAQHQFPIRELELLQEVIAGWEQ